MKILYPDRTLFVMAEEEAANYPVENIQDNYPKKYWKATSATSWVRIHADIRSAAVAISGTNAIQIDITVKQVVTGSATSTSAGKLMDTAATFVTSGVQAGDFVWNHTDQTHTTVVSVDSETQLTLTADIMSSGEGYSVEIGDLVAKTSYDLGGITSYYELITDSGISAIRNTLGYSLGYEYGYQTVKHTVLIEFFGSDSVYAGVIRAGSINTFPDPQYGLSEGLTDYSITKALNNGGRYVKRRSIVKNFSGKLILERDRDFYSFIRDVIQVCGPVPIFWWVSSNLTNQDWVVFAAYDAPPGGAHSWYQHSEVDFSITEVV
jgi:hypothetical protein